MNLHRASFYNSQSLATIILFLIPVLGISGSNTPALKLANEYRSDLNLNDYLMSEKYDGVRAYWDGFQLISRGGIVYNAPAWFTKNFGSTPLDGELWIARGRFDELSGIVRRKTPGKLDWREVSYRVFDLPKDPGVFQIRYDNLKNIVSKSNSKYLFLVEQSTIKDEQTLMDSLQAIVAQGGEGMVLQRKNAFYQGKRSDDLIKLKVWQDAEATVIKHLPGKGKYTGVMGSILVETDDGIQFRLGTGFTDAQRQSPPKPGSRVTYKYNGVSSSGRPRFASFMRIRVD